ncbi:hypothetical protein TRICI_002781 [Trichomonascus ciferrii]|uniref:Dihydrolipoamide acetyltransferase component of pyruvate dehydrogenase complex n=1 Tax=Trichomonascus ciferrii TaxID=44093 RepID=A0A642V5Y8_9ASCO|nr:hypothetical protein TRICI_002781 [Trichomonascus ciferrii]
MLHRGVSRFVGRRVLSATRQFHSTVYCRKLQPFLLADIGEGIKECEVIQWFVEPGAKIEEFDPICEVQSDKASVEITSRYNGVIKKLHYDAGQMAHVGKPLVDIDIENGEAEDTPLEQEHGQKQENSAAAATTESGGEPTTPPSPPPSKFGTLATPAVRRICRELNVDLAQVRGTGKDGRVLKEDVMRFNQQEAQGGSQAPAAASKPAPPSSEESVTKLTPIQKQMFKTMTNSLAIPHFLYTDEVRLDSLAKMRTSLNQQLASSGETDMPKKLSFMPFFIKALSLALNKYPIVNSRVSFENDQPVLISRPMHNIGVAMDTPTGLIVPNIKDVANKTIPQIGVELNRLQELGAQGKLTTNDLKGGTITVSNIGTVGGTYVAPVIVDSEVAIVGLGKAKKLPRYDNNMNVVPETIVNTSWSGDHRVIDGMTMARMVDLWKQYVENPEKMFMYLH